MYLDVPSGIFKARLGTILMPIDLDVDEKKITVRFGYHKQLVEEVKSMQGARWTPEKKCWSVPNSQRNRWSLRFLGSGFKGATFEDPYLFYNSELLDYPRRPRFNRVLGREVLPYKHQILATQHLITRRQCILAAEMGTGKSLADILAMEYVGEHMGMTTFWYVGPKSAIKSFERECIIWKSKIVPVMMTYEELTKRMKAWTSGQTAPEFVCFDESSRIKNETAQRSQAAKALADGVREDHGDTGFVVLMSGSPAPKSPADWWHQCEVACPGFLREGDIHKFRRRLGIIVDRQNSIVGGTYPHLVTWKDNEKKCNVCGELVGHENHQTDGQMFNASDTHSFVESINEVSKLYRRMKGLVLVQFKKDCLDLPEKRYVLHELKPLASTLRAAKLLARTSKTVVAGLTLLRELSDGFQYVDVPTGIAECPLCRGSEKVIEKIALKDTCPNCIGSNDPCLNHSPKYEDLEQKCPNCEGGKVKTFTTEVREVPCPKIELFKEILEDHEESGRLVVFSGFTGSIDRCVKVAQTEGWETIRIDGRGWQHANEKGEVQETKDFLTLFQELRESNPKVCIVGHAKSGGMGLTLTASRSIFYYSNSFDAEDRIQSEDRIHRPGMDENLGATIIDCVHLPTDRTILDNLKKKRDLQSMSLGECMEALDASEGQEREV